MRKPSGLPMGVDVSRHRCPDIAGSDEESPLKPDNGGKTVEF